MTQERVLVAGASGRLGQLVLEELLHAGVSQIAATTRTPQKLGAFASLGIDVRYGDFNDASSLKSAFSNVDRLLLISTDDLFSGRRVQQHKNAIAAAKRAGVRHVLYTSMPDPESSTAIPFAPDHVATEATLRESGMNYTILRVAWYAENPIELGLIPSALRTGTWFTSAAAGRIAYVTRFDVARAAAAALICNTETNHVFDITGPQALSAEELATGLSRVVGRDIAVRQVDDFTLSRELIASGIPQQLVTMLVATDANTRVGHFDRVTSTVLDLTGTAPMDFEHFLAEKKKFLL